MAPLNDRSDEETTEDTTTVSSSAVSDGMEDDDFQRLERRMTMSLDQRRPSFEKQLSKSVKRVEWKWFSVLLPLGVFVCAVYGPVSSMSLTNGKCAYSPSLLLFSAHSILVVAYAVCLRRGVLCIAPIKFARAIPCVLCQLTWASLGTITMQYISGSLFTALFGMKIIMIKGYSILRLERQKALDNTQACQIIVCLATLLFFAVNSGGNVFITPIGFMLMIIICTAAILEGASASLVFTKDLSAPQSAFACHVVAAVICAVALAVEISQKGSQTFAGITPEVIGFLLINVFYFVFFNLGGGILGPMWTTLIPYMAILPSYLADVAIGKAMFKPDMFLILLSLTFACMQYPLVIATLEKLQIAEKTDEIKSARVMDGLSEFLTPTSPKSSLRSMKSSRHDMKSECWGGVLPVEAWTLTDVDASATDARTSPNARDIETGLA
jgi:hypothetical protein